jgi:MFS family permease
VTVCAVRVRSASFRLLLVSSTLATCGYSLLLSVVPLWLAHGGSGAFGAGVSTAVFMLATVATQLGVPWLLRRSGHRALLGASLGLLGLPAPLLGLSGEPAPVLGLGLPTTGSLVISRVVLSLFVLRPVVDVVVADSAPDEQRLGSGTVLEVEGRVSVW